MIDCESKPGKTCFSILLPVESTVIKNAIIQQ